jgi:hypothetical protein
MVIETCNPIGRVVIRLIISAYRYFVYQTSQHSGSTSTQINQQMYVMIPQFLSRLKGTVKTDRPPGGRDHGEMLHPVQHIYNMILTSIY